MKIITRGLIDWASGLIEWEDSYEYAGPVMLLKDSGSAIQPVDPYTQAAAQYGLSTGTAAYNAGLNRTNQTNPLGSSTWSASYPGGNYTASAPASGGMGAIGGNGLPIGPSASGSGSIPGGSIGNNGESLGQTFNPGAASSFGLPATSNPAATYSANMSNPYGGAPTYTQNTQLAPQFDAALQQPIDTSGIIGATGGPSATDAQTQIQNALYQQQTQYLDPQFQQSNEQLNSQLANQGIMPGSEAYQNAKDQANRNQTFAYNSAANSAITGATSQEAALQGIGVTGMNADITARNTPINEYESLLGQGGGQATAQTPDISGAFGQQYSGALAGYNAQNASNNATTSDVMSLIAAGLMFASDRRVKDDIVPIGKLDNGLTVYRFRYKGDPRVSIGVMADEAEKLRPEAVVEIHGIKHVNYGAL